MFTDRKRWKESGDLIGMKRGYLFVAERLEDPAGKLPQALSAKLSELAERDEKPVKYLDI